jgi:hypothetical protein
MQAYLLFFRGNSDDVGHEGRQEFGNVVDAGGERPVGRT